MSLYFILGRPDLVERQRSLILQDPTRTLQHASVGSFGRRLHALGCKDIKLVHSTEETPMH